MKNYVIIWSVLLMFSLILTSCEKTDTTPAEEDPGNNPPPTSTNVAFLVNYIPGNELALGDQKLLGLMTVKDGIITYSAYINAYPDQSIINDGSINNNVFAMGLNWRDFDNQGMFLNLDDDAYYYMPLVEPSEDSDYSYFQASTPFVSANGLIIYSSATNDKNYGDEYRPFLLRHNPETNETKVAINANSFTFAQPEMGNDTDMAQIGRTIFASPDGRYAYGDIEAYGTEGGGIHWDYEILYQYDFETDSYTRLGEAGDDDVSINGITSDGKHLLYTNNSVYKLINLETGSISYPSGINNLVNVKKNAWGKNGPCVGATSGNIYYKDFVNDVEITVCQTSGDPENTMFTEDGNQIYFVLEGAGTNYLCLTNGISENSTYDTIGSFPVEFANMIMVR